MKLNKNPKFHRIERPTPSNWNPSQHVSDESIENLKEETKRKAKHERWRTGRSLADLTEKYIREGDSEDDAYNQAKAECGLF